MTLRSLGANAPRDVPLLALLCTLGIQVLVSMCMLALPAIAPAVARGVGVPVTLAGVYVALAFGAAMLSASAGGARLRRHGPIRLSQACLLLCGLGMALVCSGIAPLMGAGALLIGCGYGPVTPASSQLLAAHTPVRLRGVVFSLKQTGVPLGGMLAGALLPGIVVWANWRVALALVALACALAALVVQGVRARFDAGAAGDSVPRPPSRHPVALVWRHPPIRALALLSFFFAGVQLCLSTFFVAQLHQAAGLGLVRAGMLLALAQGAGVLGRITWGALADRGVPATRLLGLLALAMAGCALATAAVGRHWTLPGLVVLAACFGATATGWNGVYLAEVARLAPAGQAGLLTGGTLSFTYAGVVSWPPLFALAAGVGGRLGWGYALVGAVVGLLGFVVLLRRPR